MPNEVIPTPQAAPNGAPPAAPPAASATSAAASVAEDKDKPKTSKDFAALEKAKFENRDLKRKMGESSKQFDDRLKAESERAVKAEKELTEVRARLDKLEKGNPLEGRSDAEALIRGFVEGTTPEKKRDAAIMEAIEKVRREGDEKLAAKEAEFKAARDADLAERAKQAAENAIAGFARSVVSKENAEKYEHLNALYSEREIADMAREIHELGQQQGKTYTFQQVAEHLDSYAKKRYASMSERLKALVVKSGGLTAAGLAPPDKTGRAGSGVAGNGHRGNGPGAGASPNGSSQRDARKSREQEAEEDLAALRKATAADAAERNRQAKQPAKH